MAHEPSSNSATHWHGDRFDSAYGPAMPSPLLTPIGRVLIAVMENPGCTITEIAEFLDIHVTRVSHAVLSLVRNGILVRTKVGPKSWYEVVPKSLENHCDIRHIVKALLPVVVEGFEEA